MKRCCECGEWKAYEEYNRNCARPDGLASDCKTCKRQRYERTREKKLEYHQQYRAQNSEKIAQYHQQYRVQNSEKIAQRHQQHYERNRKKKLEYQRQYRKQNPEKILEACRRRRARKANASGDFASNQWLELCEMCGNRCLCCGEGEEGLHADHVVPLSKGGTNDIGNIQPLCGSCNSSKGARVVDYRHDPSRKEEVAA